MTDHQWHGGLVRIMTTDRRAPERRLLEVFRAVREADSRRDATEAETEATRTPDAGV
jgi:hypothetical protein